MPYIPEWNRDALRPDPVRTAATPGELNFQFTELARRYVEEHGRSYGIINDVMGALEGAKLEFYRRVAAPYEQQKMLENGDVYGFGSTETG